MLIWILRLQVLGSRKGPLECIIGATAVGPTLHFGSDLAKLSSKAEVGFGTIEVLQVLHLSSFCVQLDLTIKNYHQESLVLLRPCLRTP